MISRRSFLTCSSAAAGLTAAEAATAQTKTVPGRRARPLDGIGRENIKITDVTVTLLSARQPPGRRWAGSYPDWKTDEVLVRVFTDKGIVGIGEACPYGGPEQLKQFIEGTIKPLLIGQNPFDVELLTPVWDSVVRGQGRSWSGPPWAGVDCALWDIIGKAKNTPLYEIWAVDNKPQTRLRIYASGGTEYDWDKRPEDLIDEAVRAKEEGYTAFKYRPGSDWKTTGMTMDKFIPWVRKMRDAVGPTFDLIQEANMRWDLQQCLQLCPVLEELKFLWFEEPVTMFAASSIEEYLTIKKALPKVMISGGEQLNTRHEFKPWLDRGAYDIVQPDCTIAGPTESWYIGRMAHLRKKYCCMHNWHGGLCIMANAAMAAALPNTLMLEINQVHNVLKTEIFKDPLVVKRGYMDLPNRPGFGMELIPDVEKKFPFIPVPPRSSRG